MSSRWTYKVVEVKSSWTGLKPGDAEAMLGPLGAQGWELVSVVAYGTSLRLFLKKES